MNNPVQELKDFAPKKEYFIGIDSDGCAFDSMEIKHKECFCPQFINHFGLQPVSKYAREVWEFVNLYSKTRGCNRFLAIQHAVKLLAERQEAKDRHAAIPALKEIAAWCERETKLGNPALIAEVERNPLPELKMVLDWSLEVNEVISKIVRNVPPYPYVEESLKKMTEKADAIVVSQTPFEALDREWKEHGIDKYVRLIAGQERGTKSEHIEFAAGGKYPTEKILMIGDAPGDYKAAAHNDALFYPINPGHEEASWERFYKEGLDRFFDGSFSGEYQAELLREFEGYLPEKPSW
jgi:phosphoglycolate phosphatase-like HAD superfamily hydrolase